LSSWPPPQSPAPQQNPYQWPTPQKNRGGCGRALLVTLVLTAVTIALVALVAKNDSDYMPVLGDSVGVIRIEGPITESQDTVKVIRRFRESNLIKAIVLRLETPGGGVGASEEIYREVLKARTENDKPVIVSMGDVAASGGYYIASAADHIFATSGTITGSIGVIAPNFNASETIKKLGLRDNSIATGEHKGAGNPFDEQTTSERTLLQGVINDMYRQFFQVVLQARHEAIDKAVATADFDRIINPAGTKVPGQGVEWSTFTTGTVASAIGVPVEREIALRRLADGRIYTGEQAKLVGLVDTIGTLQDAIDYAGEKSGLGSDPSTVDRTPGSEVSSWLGASVRNFIHEATASSESIQFRSRY